MKPIIKWPGGKNQLLDKIRERLPESFNAYYEPFLGGGAVLLDLAPTVAFANDINPELINMYMQVREHVEEVIQILSELDEAHDAAPVKSDIYYDIRDQFNQNLDSKTAAQAARLIYLNKHCFNGLYRVNSHGHFNVPYNGKRDGGSFTADHLRAVSKQIHRVEFTIGDFEDALVNATKGDFVFFDSPYAPITSTSFTSYTVAGFGYEEHIRLAKIFKELTDKGVYCMLTNHDTELIRELYKDYNIEEVDVRRSINRNGNDRKGKELIITNYTVGV